MSKRWWWLGGLACWGCTFGDEPIGQAESSSDAGDPSSSSDEGSGSESTGAPGACGAEAEPGAIAFETKLPEPATSNINAAMAVAVDADCSVVVAGRLESDGDLLDGALFVHRYAGDGTALWQIVIDGDPMRREEAFDLALRSDGSMVLVGQRAGADDGPSTIPMLWDVAADGTVRTAVELPDQVATVAITPDDAVYIGGIYANRYLQRLDASFAVAWEDEVSVQSIATGSGGALAIAAPVGGDEGNVARLYVDEAVVWEQAEPEQAYAMRVAIADDGDVLVLRHTDQGDTLARVDPAGAERWRVGVRAFPNDMAIAPDGSIALGGGELDAGWVERLASDGSALWSTTLPGGTETSYPGAAIDVDAHGNTWFATGYEIPDAFQQQAWLVKLGG